MLALTDFHGVTKGTTDCWPNLVRLRRGRDAVAMWLRATAPAFNSEPDHPSHRPFHDLESFARNAGIIPGRPVIVKDPAALAGTILHIVRTAAPGTSRPRTSSPIRLPGNSRGPRRGQELANSIFD
jgi:hypothetical protein